MYKPRTLFTGFKVGFQNGNLYVAIPNKYFTNGGVEVKYKGEIKGFNQAEALKDYTFKDKFHVGQTYTLYYYLWSKEEPKVEEIKPVEEPKPEQTSLF